MRHLLKQKEEGKSWECDTSMDREIMSCYNCAPPPLVWIHTWTSFFPFDFTGTKLACHLSTPASSTPVLGGPTWQVVSASYFCLWLGRLNNCWFSSWVHGFPAFFTYCTPFFQWNNNFGCVSSWSLTSMVVIMQECCFSAFPHDTT